MKTEIEHISDTASMDAWRTMDGGLWTNAMERLRPADHLQGQALLDAVRGIGWEITVERLYRPEFSVMSQERLAGIRDAFKQAGNTEPPLKNVSEFIYSNARRIRCLCEICSSLFSAD